jgi:two-component system response regulator
MAENPDAILLVEDNPDHAELTMDAIRSSKVVNPIVWVEDGEAALDYLFRRGKYADREDGLPAVCLLDIKLPGIDGLEVLKQIRDNEALAAMPIVMLTTSQQEGEVLRAYLNHANSYVVKPISFEDFYKRIQDLNVYWVLTNFRPNGESSGG